MSTSMVSLPIDYPFMLKGESNENFEYFVSRSLLNAKRYTIS